MNNEEELSFDFFSSLNMAAFIERLLQEKHYVNVGVSFPLAAYLIGRMRIPKDFPEEVALRFLEDSDVIPVGSLIRTGDFVTVNHFADLRVAIEYHYRVSSKLALTFHYMFRYYTYERLLPFQFGASHYTLSITYDVKRKP